MKGGVKGSVLIISLWIVTLLTLLAVGIGFRASLEARLSKYNIDGMKAYYIARAGAEKALERFSENNKSYDSIRECGILLSGRETPEEVFSDENNRLGGGSFSVFYAEKDEGEEKERLYYGMMDEERRINLNYATKEVLSRLPGVTDEIASSIVDWRDPDNEPLPNGAENSYYQSFESPYRCKNGDFDALEELLLVKGVSRDAFDKIKGYVTVYGDGRINVNTASREVLRAVGMPLGLANRVVEFRNGLDREPGTDDDGIFEDINIESAIGGLSPNEAAIITGLKNLFTVRAGYLRIESRGKMEGSGVEKRICSVATKSEGKITIVSYREE